MPLNVYKAVVELTIEATDYTSATAVLETAIIAGNRARIDAKKPERLTLDSIKSLVIAVRH